VPRNLDVGVAIPSCAVPGEQTRVVSAVGVRRFAEPFGVVCRVLSVPMLAAAVVVPLFVHRVLVEHGIQDSSTPWIVLLVGLFATLMVAAIGLMLDMLCVIHDRQVVTAHAQSTVDPREWPQGEAPPASLPASTVD